MNILIFIFCVLYFILSWRRLDWAIMFLIAVLPTYLIRFKIFGVPFTLLEAMILIVFAIWFIKNYRQIIENIKLKLQITRPTRFATRSGRANYKLQITKIIRYPFDIEIILLLIISFLAAGISRFSSEALGIWKAYFFEPLLFYIVVINIFKAKDLNKIIYALAVSSLIVSFVAIWQKIIFPGERAVSFFGYPNAVGLLLGPIVLLLFGYSADKIYFFKNQKSDKDRKIFNFQFSIFKQFSIFNFQTLIIILTIIFSIAAIYFAKSEGALIGVAAGLIIFGLLAGRKARQAILALVILAVIFTAAYQPARGYAVKKFTLSDFSGQVRKQQWRETWMMLKDGRILTGAGLANYQKTFASYHAGGFYYNKDDDPDFMRKIVVWGKEYWKKVWQPVEIYLYPHNIFLNFWSELGLAGMLLFIWIFIKFYYLGIKILFKNLKFKIKNSEQENSKYLIIGLIGAISVIVVHGLVDVPYFKNDLAVMFWALLAIMGIIDLELKMEK